MLQHPFLEHLREALPRFVAGEPEDNLASVLHVAHRRCFISPEPLSSSGELAPARRSTICVEAVRLAGGGVGAPTPASH
jgi:hypothetical protein